MSLDQALGWLALAIIVGVAVMQWLDRDDDKDF